MRVSLHDKFNLLIECDDRNVLTTMQAVMDGSKVRNANAIIIPIKAGIHIYGFRQYGIEMSNAVASILNSIVDKNKKRVINIQKIKNQYYGDIKFDYECNGIYPPLNHQKVMFNSIYYSDSTSIIADVGTCKTGPYLWAIDKRIQKGIIKKCLVITLSDLKKNVIQEMSIQVPHLRGVIINSSILGDQIINKKFKRKEKNIDYDIYLANYETMRTLVKFIPENYFDMVVLDEAHRVGSPTSQQTNAIINAFENTPYKCIVTGTLHANNEMSFYMPFRFLGADTVPYSTYNEFRRRFMYSVDPDQYIWVPTAGARERIQQITGDLSVMFKKEDCLDLPGLIFDPRSCVMASEQEKLYTDFKENLVATIDDMCSKCDRKGDCDNSCESQLVAKNALVLSGKLHQIASGFYINTKFSIDEKGVERDDRNVIILDDNPKMDLLISTLSNIPSERQVIIWTNYTPAIILISKTLDKTFGKSSYITCYGNQDAYDQVQLFKTSKKPYIVANPKKMGVGQNIQFSSYQIFYSSNRSYVTRNQALGRQDRQGQTEKVTAIDLIVEKTMDVITLDALFNKHDLALNLSQLSMVLKNPIEMSKIMNIKNSVCEN